MKAIVFGHSHVWSIQRAAATHTFVSPKSKFELVIALCGTAQFPYGLVMTEGRGRMIINPALLGSLSRVGGNPKEDILISAVHGNQYNDVGLLVDGCPFDFDLPGWNMSLRADVEIVPNGAVQALLMEKLLEFNLFFERLSKLDYQGIMHLCPPPPNPDADYILSVLPTLPSGQIPEVADAQLRLKLWRVQRELMKNIVQKIGGIFLDPPPETYDSDGFLKKIYWKDSVHANAGYASLVLRDIEKTAGQYGLNAGDSR